MSVSRKLRFEIFKRDNFKCQYCGRTTPAVVLEVDHLVPVKEGGGDEQENLITSCFDCNRGKAANSLGVALLERVDVEQAIEKVEQLKAFYKAKKAERKMNDKAIESVFEKWKEFDPGYELAKKTRRTIKMFVAQLPIEEIFEAIEIARENADKKNSSMSFAYFCGVCWNKIKGTNAWDRR